MRSNYLYLIALLGILFILVGCPTGDDDNTSADDDDGDDDTGDDFDIEAELNAYYEVKAAIISAGPSVAEIQAAVDAVASAHSEVVETDVDITQVAITFESGLNGYIGLWADDFTPENSQPPNSCKGEKEVVQKRRFTPAPPRSKDSTTFIMAIAAQEVLDDYNYMPHLDAIAAHATQAGLQHVGGGYVLGGETDVDFFRSLEGHRFIYLVAHGFISLFGGVELMTGQVATLADLIPFSEDSPWTVGIGSNLHDSNIYLTVNHHFFEQYNYEGVTLYLESCNSMRSAELAESFQGAQEVVGWSANTAVHFSFPIARGLIGALFEPGSTTEHAFASPIIEELPLPPDVYSISVDELMPICVYHDENYDPTYEWEETWDVCVGLADTEDNYYMLELKSLNGDAILIPGNGDQDGDGYDETVDCDDNDPNVNPGAPETTCNGVDDDCDVMTLDEPDGDGDGDSVCVDCDDTDASLNLDDLDWDGWSTCEGDWDDNDPTCYPGATEICDDGSDNNGDGLTDCFDLNCAGDGSCNTSLALATATFIGENEFDNSGCAVSSAGDVDGDGFDDILIGADTAGKTYFLLGSTVQGGGTFNLSAADAEFIGEGGNSGRAVSSAGDIDGDGLHDILIGAENNGDGGYYAGKAYLLFGSTIQGGGSFSLSTADSSFVGEYQNDNAGSSVSSAGDVDGDGLDDILIGAEGHDFGDANGRTYLLFGSTVQAGGTFDLSIADASFGGEGIDDQSGCSVSSAGDVDGDGLDDILIGAKGYDWYGDTDVGKTYLMFGSTVQGGGNFSLWNQADGSFRGWWTLSGDRSGYSVSSAGDVDGDGLDDILIGAPYYSNYLGSEAGRTYLMLGSTVQGGGSLQLWNQNDNAFGGEDDDDRSGSSVSSAGDVDGDGLDDIIIGAYRNDDGGTDAGKTYLMHGSTVLFGGIMLASQTDTAFVGENPFDFCGYSVSSAGDVNGDGNDDILIGAPRNDDGGSSAGKTYLLINP